MIREKKVLFLRTLRLLLQDEDIQSLLRAKRYDLVTVISYQPINLPSQFRLTKKPIINIYVNKNRDFLAEFKRTTRQEIQKTFSIPELSFIAQDQNLDATYTLYKAFEYAQGRVPWGKDSFHGTILFNAYVHDKIISSLACYDLFPYLQIRAMFSKRHTKEAQKDHSAQKLIGYATRRLIYEACQFAVGHGYTFVGLGSVNFNDPQKARVSEFKNFFGGIQEYEYTYIYKSLLFRFAEIIIKFRNFFLKFLNRL